MNSEDLKELVAQIDNAILNLNPLTGYGEDAVWRPADKARSALITSREAITRLVGEVEGLRSSRDLRSDADAALPAEQADSGGASTGAPDWLPIKSAPRDGTWFLAAATEPGWRAVRVVHFAAYDDRLPVSGDAVVWPSVPTLWMPLSHPPPANTQAGAAPSADPMVGNAKPAQTEDDRSREHALSLRVGELEEGLRKIGGVVAMLRVSIDDLQDRRMALENCDAAIDQASRLLSEKVSSATVDPVKVEAATPLAGQAEKYLALPSETACSDCGRANPVWFAPSPLWNRVMGGAAATDDPGGIVCPNCFIRRAEAAGDVPSAWVLSPETGPALALSAPPLKGKQGLSADANAKVTDSAATPTVDEAGKYLALPACPYCQVVNCDHSITGEP